MHERRAYNLEETHEDHMRDSAYEAAYDTALENDSLRMIDDHNMTFQGNRVSRNYN